MRDRNAENDEAIASLIGALAEQYRRQIHDPDLPANEIRMEIVRKLALIADAVKGLMKSRQSTIDL